MCLKQSKWQCILRLCKLRQEDKGDRCPSWRLRGLFVVTASELGIE